jgi:hypothetical protein
MIQLFSVILMVLSMTSCSHKKNGLTGVAIAQNPAPVNPYTHIDRIPLPAGFARTAAYAGTFAAYLRKIGLKEQTTVYLYNDQPKSNQTAQYAVLNISVGNKDLQQCADAVMRLRAEYLFEQKQFYRIIFLDNSNTSYKFSPPYTRYNLDKYLNRVFGMCGTASLAKQLNPVNSFAEIEQGDVLIRGGFPGHAVIVMDVALNNTGKKIYLLAQSYMPAQDIHILKNPSNENLSPWYEVDDNYIIQTPEYTFTQNELMRW